MSTTYNPFSLLIIRFILASSFQCQIESYYKNENIYTDFHSIQSNQTDFYKIIDIEYNLIEKVCSAPYQVDGEIIQTILIPNFFKNNFALCHLVLNSSNYIICTNLPFPFCKENFQKLLKIELEIKSKEFCQNLIYLESEKKMIIFCTNNSGFFIKEIDFENKLAFKFETTYMEEEGLSDCKMEAIHINHNTFLLAFINCSNWKYYKINSKNITLILDSKIIKIMNEKLEIHSDSNFYPTQFLYCQHTIYFTQISGFKSELDEHYIYEIFFDSDFNIKFFKQISMKSDNIIKITVYLLQQQFKKVCKLHSILVSKNNSENFFDEEKSQVILGKDYLETEIYFSNDLMLIQNLSTLIVVKNEIQNQTLTIGQGRINFLHIFNSFYQLDNNLIEFYQFQNDQNFHHLTENYLYQFTKKGIFQAKHDNVLCFLIQNTRLKQNQISYNNSAEIPYTCNQKGSIEILNSQLNFRQDVIYPIKGDNLYVNITKSSNFSEKCLQNISHIVGNQSYKIMQMFQFSIDYYLLISIQNYLHIYQCGKDYFQNSLNIENGYVYCYSYAFAILRNNKLNSYILTEIGLIQLPEQKIRQITKVQQLNSILYITNTFRTVIIDLLTGQQPQENYFDIIFLNETILFCNIDIRFILIQYQSFFFVQIQDQLFYQDLFNSTIVLTQLKQTCIIISVSDLNNTISLHDFNKLKLQLRQNLFIPDYQLLRPILYKSSMKSRVAIAALKKQEKFVLVVELVKSEKLNLIDITNCQHFNFYFIGNNLYFIDPQNDISLIYLDIKIINYFLPQQLNLYHTLMITETFSQISNFSRIDLKIKNFCPNLLPIQDQIQIFLDFPIQLQAQDYFYGPIDKLKIQSSSKQFSVDLETPQTLIAANQILQCQLISPNSICIDELVTKNQFNYEISYHQILIDKIRDKVFYPKYSEVILPYKQLVIFQNHNKLVALKIAQDKIFVFEFQQNESRGNFIQTNNYVLFEFQVDIYFKRIENFIAFKLNPGQGYFCYIFHDGKFIPQNFNFHQSLSIKKLIIEQSEQSIHLEQKNYFLSVIQQTYNNSYFYFSVYEFRDQNIEIVQNFSLYSIELFNECQKFSLYGYCQIFQDISFKTIQLGECFIQNQKIQLQLILLEQKFSVYFTVIYDLDQIRKEILDIKIIRHPLITDNIQASQFGNIIFLKFQDFFSFSTFVYDLQNKEKTYLDYIYHFNDTNVSFFPFNTTHFVMTYQNDDKVQGWALLSFQYKIKVNKINFKQKLKNQSLTILASNKLSNFTAEITLILNENDEIFQRKFPILDLSLQFGCFILIVLILIVKRKNPLKKNVKKIKVHIDFHQNQSVS